MKLYHAYRLTVGEARTGVRPRSSARGARSTCDAAPSLARENQAVAIDGSMHLNAAPALQPHTTEILVHSDLTEVGKDFVLTSGLFSSKKTAYIRGAPEDVSLLLLY